MAGALRNQAQHITAVEIDPGVYQIGRKFHPESPYANSSVNVVIDDARSFLKKTKMKYDLISFGLLDSHTQSSSFNNLRIDHYVYTVESFKETTQLLGEDGVLTVVFSAQRPWIAARIKHIIHKAFGHEPLTFRIPQTEEFGWGGIMYVIGKNPIQIQKALEGNTHLQEFVNKNRVVLKSPVKLTTDDWPYLYILKARIPKLHLCVSFIIIFLFLILKKYVIGKGQKVNAHFFLLGVGFLLIEFQNISKTALLFGSTWVVNSLVISTILILILAANFVSARWKRFKR